MLGSLFSSKPDHPLADAKEARRIFTALQSREPATAIDEATALLESLVGVEGFKPEQRLGLILQLDEAAIVPARRLGREYVSARLTRPQEQALWLANRDYWATLIAALEDNLRRFDANEKGAEAIKPTLPLLYGRLLHAARQRLKWEQFRYGPVDGALWQLMGRIYLAAAGTRLAERELELYSGSGSTTAAGEYLKALVFHASSMDNLLPVEIELAEHLIAHFLPHFVFTAEVRPDNVYWADAAKPLPPARLARPPEISSTLRFFNSIPAVEAIEQLRGVIGRDGRVPPELNLGGQYAIEAVLPVLDHLAMCWAPTPPMRKDARHRVKSRLAVVHGVAEIHHQLQGHSEFGESESWVVDDVSLGGMGAKVALGASDWVRIGSLIGLQPDGGGNWLVGMVRRFSRDSNAVGSVGIETLSKSPRAIVADAGGLQTEGILLDAPQQGESVRVALPADSWEEGVSLLFALDGARVRLFPEAELERSSDMVLGRCFVQSIE
ncbi:MAG: hypothetical protein KJ787_05975 [Gammaproteobacteria bacterium]|nr:hypothetical protein [Gammaproteobacteria bacterium]MBU1645861.1 hypothetical protein [Gammaproteobacteria bacterium]MBU1971923.1 hypothetical protein [Gammaproteobacteria bacterium]